MEAPLCQSCTEKPSEIVVIPGQNPDVMTEYLCSRCFSSIKVQHYQALPYTFIMGGSNNQPEGKEQEFGFKAGDLIVNFYAHQEQIKAQVAQVKNEYTLLFTDLLDKLKSLQIKVMSTVNDTEAIEIEHINAMIQDLKTTQADSTLTPDTAYLASYFNSPDTEARPPFIIIPEGLDGIKRLVEEFPEPIINPTKYELQDDSSSIQKTKTLRMTRRLIEDDAVLMPIDTLNMLFTDFFNVNPERRMIPCSNFPYRVQARWCKVEDSIYIYTGGLYKGAPIPWCDFIDISAVASNRPEIRKLKGKDMKLARHRHAVICHDHTVYAFGGGWAEAETDIREKGVEILQQYGDWNISEWQVLCEMPEIFDPTVTVLKNVIYLAGKNRGIYRFDIISRRFMSVNISRIIDLQIAAQIQEAPASVIDPRFPLPRQSSNSLIFSWESQIVVLQHDSMFSFGPGEKVEMSKKRVSVTKDWCSPFPVIIKGSKGYFMLEPTETDLMPAGDVWCFDFIKRDVSLVDFNKAKDK